MPHLPCLPHKDVKTIRWKRKDQNILRNIQLCSEVGCFVLFYLFNIRLYFLLDFYLFYCIINVS